MKPSQASEALDLYLNANQPVFIHGPPGCGKSSIVHQAAARREMLMIDMRLSQLDAVDLRGIPYREDGVTCWAANSQLPNAKKHGPRGILFLDEMNAAAKSTMAAGYQLVLDRRIGDYVVPEGWRIVAAGNQVSDRAIVENMPTPLKNRFAHIFFETDNEDWCKWAIERGISLEVFGFIRFRPNLLNDFERALNGAKEHKARVNDLMAFATPRSWEFIDRVFKTGVPSHLEFDVYGGLVGEGPAAEFIAYCKHVRNLPNLDALLLNPENTAVPEESAVLYALAVGLAAKASVDNFERMVKYLYRMPAEFQVLTTKDAVMRNGAICNTAAFNQWATVNADVLI